MTTLAEIESAADALPDEEQHELLRFLLQRLSLKQASLPQPEPRQFTREQMQEWIDRDEADMRRFNAGE